MSRNASGTYSLPAGQPVVTGTTISASTFNTLTSDVSTEISDSLSRSGKGGMSSALVLNSAVAVGTPDLSFSGDTDTGLYRIAANNFGLSCSGAKVVDVATTGIAVTGTLSASGVTSIADGAVGTPGINFTTDTDCGLYRIGANDIAITVGGVKQFELTTAAATIVQALTCSGAVACSSTLAATGNFAINTNKFTVTAASGNTLAAGTLNVTGAAVFASTLSAVGITSTGGATVSGGTTALNGGGSTGLTVVTSGNAVGATITGSGTGGGLSVAGGATAGANGVNAAGGAGGGNAAVLTATGTYAPLNLAVVTATPTTLANGDMWIENVAGTWHFKIRMNGATSTIV